MTRDMPYVPGRGLLGCARPLREAPHRFVAETALQHNGIARFRVLHRRLIAVSHPDLIRHVLVTRHDHYERSFHYHTSRAILGLGLLTTDGPIWKLRRRQIQPAFHPDKVARVHPAACAAAHALFERWECQRRAGLPVPLVADLQAFTLDAMCRALISTPVDSDDARTFGNALRESLYLVRRKNNAACPIAAWIPTPTHRALAATRRIFDRFLTPHLHARSTPNATPQDDILQNLLEVRDPDSGLPLPPQALLDETKTLFAAGFETTATALTWALHTLSHHPDIAHAWHTEIDRTLAGRTPSWSDLDQLDLTSRIVQETLRLFPPVYTLGRVCTQDDSLAGFPIRKGETLLLSVYGAHRSPEFWPDPDRFNPDRFTPNQPWPKHAFLPFALGKHQCIGNTFALAEASLLLALVGQRYQLRPTLPFNIPARAQVTLVPAHEIPVHLIPRT